MAAQERLLPKRHLYSGLDHSGTVGASLKHSVPFVRKIMSGDTVGAMCEPHAESPNERQQSRSDDAASRRKATVLRWRLKLVGSPRLWRGWQALPKRAVHQRVNLQAGVASGESAAGRRCVRERQYRANKGPLSRPRRLVDRWERCIGHSVAGCPAYRFAGGEKLLELSIDKVRRLATTSGREARPGGRT